MFTKVKNFIQYRLKKTEALFNIHRYEKMINKAWKRSLTLPYDKRVEVGTQLLYHEANLERMKRLYADA